MFWGCDERNTKQQQQQQHQHKYLAQLQQRAVEVAMVVVRTATPTPDLGHPRRLPTQAMHRAGASHRTKSLTYLFGPTDAMCVQFVFLVPVFPSRSRCFVWVTVIRFLYVCLANHSAVSIRRKALKCKWRLRDSWLLQYAQEGVHAALCWSLYTLLVLSLFFCCLDLPTDTCI